MDDPLFDPAANEPDNDGYSPAALKHVMDGVSYIAGTLGRSVTSAEYDKLRMEARAMS